MAPPQHQRSETGDEEEQQQQKFQKEEERNALENAVGETETKPSRDQQQVMGEDSPQTAEAGAVEPTGDGKDDDDEKDNTVSVSEIVYGVESFYVIVKPVLATMVLSALAVVYVNTPETIAAGQASISATYNVYGNAAEAGDTTGQQLSVRSHRRWLLE